MAFWGVEVKPGRPFTYLPTDAKGRLHISQATLGTGSGMNKSIVQCNVGNKSPVFLCALFPEQTETCQLNLEFEEADEVVLSVLGSRSVHITGYYLSSGRFSQMNEDSESFGEDIAVTDSDRSADDEEYDDSFIDDGNPAAAPSSPLSEDDISNEESPKKSTIKRRGRRLRKMYQSSDSDKVDVPPPNHVVNGKEAIQASDSEDILDEFFKSSSKKQKDSKVAVKKYSSDSDKVDVTPPNHVVNGKEAIQASDSEGILDEFFKFSSKKQKDSKVAVKEDNLQGSHDGTETKAKKDDNISEIATAGGPLAPMSESVDPELTKKQKRKLKERLGKHDSDIKEASLGVQEDINKEESKEKRKQKKKKRKLQNGIDVIMGRPTDKNDEKISFCEDSKVESLAQVRELPNGLIIEELALGSPDEKVAVHGKKIKVHFVGKIKENGQIIDSNIGEKPLKLHLGNGQVMEGWDDGLEGIRAGGKRRLFIPPSLRKGSKKLEDKGVKPDSWLIYDVEVVSVR